MTRPAPLDPLRFPLHGSQLIEASAGTGKTYTIALLYLRLVLGHGAAEAPRRELMPPDILVVTFTEAATDELRARIRSRLSEAAALFRADPRAGADEALRALRDAYAPQHLPALAQRLQRAADWMDEAAIATIHGWCHRMLREHAFDSGSLFSQTLQPDQAALRAQALRDWWRSHIAPLPAALARCALACLGSPAALERSLTQALAVADLLPEPEPPAQLLATHAAERARVLDPLKAQWRAWLPELRRLLDAACAARQFNGTKLRPEYYGPWLDKLAAWADDPLMLDPDAPEAFYRRFTPESLIDARASIPPGQRFEHVERLLAHPAIGAPARLQAAIAALPDDEPGLLAHAVRWVRARMARENAQLARFGFDDLLTRFEAALRGPHGEALAARIREQFPVAMIDEFQDTDPVQYGIVDAIYRVARTEPATSVILIGDPKQAIYGFRGADIHTYLTAREHCAGRLHTLDRNFRSTPEAVAAVNHLFERAEARPRGAFRFGSGADSPLPFLPVRARGRTDQLLVDGCPPTGLTFLALDAIAQADKPRRLTKTQAQPLLAAAFARTIAGLLEAGRAGRAVLRQPDGERPLLPADIAVLVGQRSEAAIIRGALARLGVRTVYLSDRDSVYDSEQAWELQCWLEACAEPADERRLRSALATPSLGLSLTDLAELGADEQAWEARVLQFRALREVWRTQGVLPMLRRLLAEFAVPARLLAPMASTDGPASSGPISGERRLTDLLHLAELMQQASAWLDGEQALIRHLAAERAGDVAVAGGADGATADDRQVRLESDADLVTVVTVHKSKGLEYPLVFLPFGGESRIVKEDDRPVGWHEGHVRRATLQAEPAQVALADEERLAEDLRKLYVALTRARFATWVGLAATADLDRSAFGHLLDGSPVTPGTLADRLRACAGDCAAMTVEELPPIVGADDGKVRGDDDDAGPSAEEAAPPADAAAPVDAATGAAGAVSPNPSRAAPAWPIDGAQAGAARRPRRQPAPAWWIASYSAIARADSVALPAPDSPGEANLVESRHDALPGAPPARSPDGPHAFPRGPEAGTFLHDLLEWAAREGFAAVCASPELLRDQIARRCQVRGWQRWIEPLVQWLRRVMLTELDPGHGGRPLRLADLASTAPELEFWMSVRENDTHRIDRLVSSLTLAGEPRPPIAAQTINGMLKGYIDLVFEHDGRYWVADYKSNWLGPDAQAYGPAALRASVLAARYELQYTLYLVALHRLLTARLPHYDYDRHVGGALYLYLRGIEAPGAGVHRERPSRELIEQLDRLFAPQAAGEAAP
jgi:exodeoxyribonuclease V beta subunit